MKMQEKYYQAQAAAEDIHHYLTKVGVTTYITPSCHRFLWVPWAKQIINLNDTKEISHALVMSGYMAANIPLRARVVDEFISIARNRAHEIRTASDCIKAAARALRLY